MNTCITTYTGRSFDPTRPKAEDIHIADIAHALSLICRGNGHVNHFFSVGQHCLHCAGEALARGYSPRVAMACLIHDASEAYMSDVPRPFKAYLGEYRALEEKFMDVVYEKYLGSPLKAEEKALMEKIDDDMLWYNLRDLLYQPPEGEAPAMKSEFSQAFVPFEEIEAAYLALFEKLSSALS